MKPFPKRPTVGWDTQQVSTGCITLDCVLARKFGWSEKLLNEVQAKLHRISINANTRSHWSGPVKGCPCISCDVKGLDEELPEEYLKDRMRWRKLSENRKRRADPAGYIKTRTGWEKLGKSRKKAL